MKAWRGCALTSGVLAVILLSQAALADWWPVRGDGERGSGNLITEERQVDDFTRIENSGSADIFVTVGEKKKVEVRIDDNLVDYIITEVQKGTLQIYSEESYSSRHGCVIEISVPSLEEITASGSGDIEIEGLKEDVFSYQQTGSGEFVGQGKVELLSITLSGSGDVEARELTADDVSVKISGSGDANVYATKSLEARASGSGGITAEGEVVEAEIETTGSGDINAGRLVAQNVYARTRGSGDITLFAVKSLDAYTTGSGDILYYGDPKDLTRKSSGSGKIRRK